MSRWSARTTCTNEETSELNSAAICAVVVVSDPLVVGDVRMRLAHRGSLALSLVDSTGLVEGFAGPPRFRTLLFPRSFGPPEAADIAANCTDLCSDAGDVNHQMGFWWPADAINSAIEAFMQLRYSCYLYYTILLFTPS